MTCEQFLELVGTLTPMEMTFTQRKVMVQHLETCEKCMAKLTESYNQIHLTPEDLIAVEQLAYKDARQTYYETN